MMASFWMSLNVTMMCKSWPAIATLWNYGASYEKGLDGKPLPRKTQMVFKVILQKIWGFRPRYKASTSETVKYQATDPNSPVEKYWAEVLASNNP